MSEAGRIFGIDLGTTYSAIAYVDEHGQPVVAKNVLDDNSSVMPSVVLLEDSGETVVGAEAKKGAAGVSDESRVFEEVKRRIGDESYVPVEVDGTTYTPEIISSLILRKLAMYAEEATGNPVQDAVITVPAYFDEARRDATRTAGELAGLNVRHILNEPTAAALCYGLDRGVEGQTVLVYDLGGGTFDITVIRVEAGKVQVLLTGGDFNLGGKRWDDEVVKYVASRFEEEHGINPLDDPLVTQDLRLRCEDAKKTLTNRPSAKIMVSFGQRSTVELSRETFDELTGSLLSRSLDLTRVLVDRAKSEKGVAQIDELLLVGGSTRMPQVAAALEAEFGTKPQLYDPDEAVAKGAALMGMKIVAGDLVEEATGGRDLDDVPEDERAAVIDRVSDVMGLPPAAVEQVASTKVINVNSHALGVVTFGDRVAILLQEQTPLPTSATQQFGTVEDSQENANIRVVQCLAEVADPGNLAAWDQLNEDGNLLPLPPGLPEGSGIEVSFNMDEQGMLRVFAEDLVGHSRVEFVLERKATMSTREIEEAKQKLSEIQVQ